MLTEQPPHQDRTNPPAVDRLLLWALALMMIARTCSNMVTSDPDLWGHVLYGLDHLKTGLLARIDPYSYTAAGRPWINHEWLCELIFAWSWRHFGAVGLWAVRLMLFGATILIVVRLVAESTRGLWCGLMTLTVCWLEINRGTAIRPQLFTMALMAVLLLIIRRVFEQRRWPPAAAFLLVPLMAAWTNLHGGFVVGLGLIGLVLVRELAERRHGLITSRRLGITLAAISLSAAATLVNPYGWRLWEFLAHALGTPAGGRIGEWGSMFSFRPQSALVGFYATLLLLLVAAPAMARARDGFELVVLLGMAAAALLQTRHGPLFCIVAAAWLPKYLEVAVPRLAAPPRFPRPFAIAVTCVVLLYAVGTHLRDGGRPGELRVPAASHPIDAFRFMRDNEIGGNLLVMFNWAQSALWYLHERCKIAYDGRFNTVYPMEVEDAYFAFHFGGGRWTDLIDRYDTQLILMPRDWTKRLAMSRRDDWRIVFEGAARTSPLDGSDTTPVLFVRRDVELHVGSSSQRDSADSMPTFFRFGAPRE